jgi:hypothetical protein
VIVIEASFDTNSEGHLIQELVEKIPHLVRAVRDQPDPQIGPGRQKAKNVSLQTFTQFSRVSLRHSSISNGVECNAVGITETDRRTVRHSEDSLHGSLGSILPRPAHRPRTRFFHRQSHAIEGHTDAPRLCWDLEHLDQRILDVRLLGEVKGTERMGDVLETRAAVRETSRVLGRLLCLTRGPLLEVVRHGGSGLRKPIVSDDPSPQRDRIDCRAVVVANSSVQMPLDRHRTCQGVVVGLKPPHAAIAVSSDRHLDRVDIQR